MKVYSVSDILFVVALALMLMGAGLFIMNVHSCTDQIKKDGLKSVVEEVWEGKEN